MVGCLFRLGVVGLWVVCWLEVRIFDDLDI